MTPREAELAAEVARLRAALAWRPISEAPRDGTEVIVCRPKGRFIPRVGIDRVVNGLWEFSSFRRQPTHWQPLPPPPAQEPTDA